MNVRFTEEAVSSLRNLHAFIAADSPQNAAAVIRRLIERAESLSELHLRGRKVPEYDDDSVREIHERPYRIIYRVSEIEVQVLTILHMRQLLPFDLPKMR